MLRPVLLQRQLATRFTPEIVQQQRILTEPLWKQSLCEPRYEGDSKDPAAALIGTTNVHPAISHCRRLNLQRCQTFSKHVAHFRQSNRANRSHRTEIGENAQHKLRTPEHARSKLFEVRYPLPPARIW